MLLVALACLSAGSALAWHHPLWPVLCLAALWLWVGLVVWQAGVWLWVVPAFLPVLNFSPWTGWLVFEEFDLLLLGALAGAYARMAWAGKADRSAKNYADSIVWLLPAALAGLGLPALWRGFEDAGGFRFDWFAGYSDALNSWRVFKSLGFALLFIPLLRWHASRGGPSAPARLAQGMVVGLTLVTLAVLWERAAFPGVFDFSANYRTVALFWEMHVGGAAIDAYLVMSSPFVLWALMATRRPVVWLMLALLAVLTAYACLTTFSRGVYLAVAAPLLLLALWRWRHKRVPALAGGPAWRARANGLLAVVLLLEVLVVLVGGSFMADRLTRTGRDLSSRVEHWRNGLDLVATPTDWLLGKGLGRLPANYAAQVPNGEFPGAVSHHIELQQGQAGNAFVTLHGPKTRPALGGSFALTQRVDGAAAPSHQARLDVRVEHETRIELYLCERHLLYDRRCQAAAVRVNPVKALGEAAWQPLTVTLQGDSFGHDAWPVSRLMMLSISVVNVGGATDIDNVALLGQGALPMLANSDFSAGMAHWFPAAQSYFVPWHLDNLYLELLVERGLPGLLVFLAMVAHALWRVLRGPGRLRPLSPYLAASLLAVLLVGLVSSVMDVPRVAFLFFLLVFAAMASTGPEANKPVGS